MSTHFGPAFLGASLDPHIAEIDLHEFRYITDALEHMDRELFQFSKQRERYCRVIHGVGEGKMARAVHEALDTNPLVHASECDEYGGACIVLF